MHAFFSNAFHFSLFIFNSEKDNKEVVIPIEASLSHHDPLGKWYDHKACWKMQYRGSLGESLLHVLIICDTKIHTKLARILLRVFPILSVDVMEGEEYLGASALHLAIAYSNNGLVADLIEAGADVNQRAIGKFVCINKYQIMIIVLINLISICVNKIRKLFSASRSTRESTGQKYRLRRACIFGRISIGMGSMLCQRKCLQFTIG